MGMTVKQDVTEIKVGYTVFLSPDQFRWAREVAEERGYGYNDSGPIEMVRRMLISDGIEGGCDESKFGLVNYSRPKS